LLDKQEKENRTDIAVVRLEQLYPLPMNQLLVLKEKYAKAEFIWAQEEPVNMGAWSYLLLNVNGRMNMRLVSRKASASPATGFGKVHAKEQAEIVDTCFA
jgi:2-oxoglutarate dehydrogenase E1 component